MVKQVPRYPIKPGFPLAMPFANCVLAYLTMFQTAQLVCKD